MGGEQSRESVGGQTGHQNSINSGNRSASTNNTNNSHHPLPVSSSPRPSISSDADLPYISYTVNRPIGGEYSHIYLIN